MSDLGNMLDLIKLDAENKKLKAENKQFEESLAYKDDRILELEKQYLDLCNEKTKISHENYKNVLAENKKLNEKYMQILEENLALRECVEFYADEQWKLELDIDFFTLIWSINERKSGKIINDHGELARKILSEIDNK